MTLAPRDRDRVDPAGDSSQDSCQSTGAALVVATATSTFAGASQPDIAGLLAGGGLQTGEVRREEDGTSVPPIRAVG